MTIHAPPMDCSFKSRSAQVLGIKGNIVAVLAERGCRIESVTIGDKIQTPRLEPKSTSLSRKEAEELLGIKLTDGEFTHCLEKMRYGARILKNAVEVSVPAYRADILHSWDLIEDIAIGYGFDKIKLELPATSTIGKAHQVSKLRDSIREIMVGLGYFEVMPFTLTSERVQFGMMHREKASGITHILYPISEDHTIVRPTLLPNLLEILSINKHRELPQRIFEVGEVVINCKTSQRLGAVAIHPQANFTEIQAMVDAVMRERRIAYEVADSDDSAFIEGRRADVIIKGERAGVFGELHPEVISNFGLEHPIIGFELEL